MKNDFKNVGSFMFAIWGLIKRMTKLQSERQSGIDDSITYILKSLLQLQCSLYGDANESKYVFLESLLRYIRHRKNRNQFPDKVISPVISKEDGTYLLVEDKNFALIFGDIADGVIEQDSRLLYHIKCIKEKGYKEEQIFVINLTVTDSCDSSSSLNENLRERYIKLSLKEDIIDWLETEVINILPLVNDNISEMIYLFYKCLIEMFHLDNKMESKYKVIFDTELQRKRKMADEQIIIFEHRAKKSSLPSRESNSFYFCIVILKFNFLSSTWKCKNDFVYIC